LPIAGLQSGELQVFEVIFQKLRIPIFEKVLDASADTQRAIATNIANVATPGYKAKEVDFKEILDHSTSGAKMLRRTDPRHIPMQDTPVYEHQVEIIESASKGLKSGKNNIDIDVEMTKAAENQLFYSANAKIIGSKFAALHRTIRGRS
jgi:flagellar basal-body rod protein FlgB